MIRVVLVDDQQLVRAGFRMVLDYQSDITVVGEAGDGAEALRLLRTTEADVVVMDLRMPVLDGVAATRQICAAGPAPRVLVLTTFDTDEEAFAALRAGASGFLLKDVPPADLLSAIRAVAGGHAVVAPAVTRRLLERFAPLLPDPAAPDDNLLDRLTGREREILGLVARGLTNTEIAGELTLSEATVKAHVGRVLAKLELRDRIQIVIFAYENRLTGRA